MTPLHAYIVQTDGPDIVRLVFDEPCPYDRRERLQTSFDCPAGSAKAYVNNVLNVPIVEILS